MKKFGDWAIALTVVACSAVLFFALVFALQGNPFAHPSRTIRAYFPDVTGIQPSSLVKYAGATAGTVHRVRILTPDERVASGNPENIIELTIALNDGVPALSTGVTATVGSDTLLSDKFVLLSGGNPHSPALANGALIPGIPPVTFDAILRDLGGAMVKIRTVFDAAPGSGLDGLLPLAQKTLAQLGEVVGGIKQLLGTGNTLLTDASGLMKSGDGLLSDGRSLIAENRPALTRLLTELSQTADSLDSLAKRADQLVETSGPNIDASAREARSLLRELKETAVSAHALVDQLRLRPQSLLWGPGRGPKPEN